MVITELQFEMTHKYVQLQIYINVFIHMKSIKTGNIYRQQHFE